MAGRILSNKSWTGWTLVLGLFSLSLAGVAVSGLQAASNGNAEARSAYDRALEHDAQGDPRSARIELMNAIKFDPEWVPARIAQAQVLLRLSDGIGAQSELDRAIDLGQEEATVRHLYGHALQLQGNLRDAREELLSGDIPFENQAYAARILGRVAMYSADDALASQAFDRAIQLEPDNADLWVDVSEYRLQSGNQSGAMEAVKEAVRLDPANIRALRKRGELLRSQFGLRAALPWFERALQIDPNDIPVLTEYAATLGDMGRMAEMLIIARKIISLDGKNPRAFFMQSVLAARAGKYDLARTLMQKTEGRLDDVPAVILVQGIIEHAEGNYNTAIERFRRLSAMQPHNRKAQHLLAQSLYMAGDAGDAANVLRAQVMQDGAEPYALWLAGKALEATGDRAAAMDWLNRAAYHRLGRDVALDADTPIGLLRAEVARNPGNARIVIPYIRALSGRGDHGSAYVQARELQRNNPGVSDAHLLVADVSMARGDYSTAMEALYRAKQIRFSEPVMLRMVDALRAQKEMQRSGEILAEYLHHNPASIAALRWMAYAHLETENWDVARRILENLRARIGPNDALIMAGLAQAYTGLGRTAEAIRAGRIAYHVQPSSPVVSHLYGLALLADGSRNKDAADLLRKAVALVPDNQMYRQSLRLADAAVRQERDEKSG